MADPEHIRKVFERNVRAIELRPGIGKSTTVATVRVYDGTTCEVTGSGWTLTADLGLSDGGNNAGPGPGVYSRAALGSCLAIGYAQWAAMRQIPLDSLRVEVETNFDARGMFGIDDRQPGFTRVRYRVFIESPADASEIEEMVEQADRLSPTLADLRDPVPVEREIIIHSRGKPDAS
ncbi:MAG: OsmC family protein [Rhodothermia bacterium]|nr:OsmC family protein [Rhodothermia bacterium]